MNFKTIATVISKVPWPVWAFTGLVALGVSGDAWYNHKLDDAEARGRAEVRVALVRDSTHREIAKRDTAVAQAKATTLATTKALSGTLATLRADNTKLRNLLDEYDLDSTDVSPADSMEADFKAHLIRRDSLEKLPDSTLVEVPMELVRAADKVSHDLDTLQTKYTADSVAHAAQSQKQDGVIQGLRDALAAAEKQIPIIMDDPKVPFWKRVWGVTRVVLDVVGTVALVVLGVKVAK